MVSGGFVRSFFKAKHHDSCVRPPRVSFMYSTVGFQGLLKPFNVGTGHPTQGVKAQTRIFDQTRPVCQLSSEQSLVLGNREGIHLLDFRQIHRQNRQIQLKERAFYFIIIVVVIVCSHKIAIVTVFLDDVLQFSGLAHTHTTTTHHAQERVRR